MTARVLKPESSPKADVFAAKRKTHLVRLEGEPKFLSCRAEAMKFPSQKEVREGSSATAAIQSERSERLALDERSISKGTNLKEEAVRA